MHMMKKQNNIKELVPLFLSIIVAVVALLYDQKTQKNAKDPQLVLYKEGLTGIRFSIENEKVQADWCTLVFPSYGDDTVAVFAPKINPNSHKFVSHFLGPFRMTLDTDWFKYFELLASCNNITENEVFTLPFCVDMYYHHLDMKMRAVYHVNLDLCLRNRKMHIENWNYEKIQISRIKENHVRHCCPVKTDQKFFEIIEN